MKELLVKTAPKVKSSNHKIILANFDVLADTNPTRPVVAIMVEPKDAKPFILPMDLRAARDLSLTLLQVVLQIAPGVVLELVDGEQLRKLEEWIAA